jgi:saccharopine dehydrogenase-like NADP-dependent oxidoreductase
MLEQARIRASTKEEEERIEYKQLDVTDPAAVEELLKEPNAVSGQTEWIKIFVKLELLVDD